MNKQDLKLIGAFIDNKNIKEDLNYAHLKEDGIYATNTKRAIHFNIPMLNLDMCVHKKLLAGFANIADKDDEIAIDGFGFIRLGAKTKMNCDNFPDIDYKKVDFKNVFKTKFDYRISLDEIDDLHFELTQKNCFIDDIHINPIIEYSSCARYEIFFNKQTVIRDKVTNEEKTNTGIAKIIGLVDTEDEKDVVKFTAIVMGREFKTKAQEQLLFKMD